MDTDKMGGDQLGDQPTPTAKLDYARPESKRERPLILRLLIGALIGLAVSPVVIVLCIGAVILGYRRPVFYLIVTAILPGPMVAVRRVSSLNEMSTFTKCAVVQFVLYGLIITWCRRDRRWVGWTTVLVMHVIAMIACMALVHW